MATAAAAAAFAVATTPAASAAAPTSTRRPFSTTTPTTTTLTTVAATQLLSAAPLASNPILAKLVYIDRTISSMTSSAAKSSVGAATVSIPLVSDFRAQTALLLLERHQWAAYRLYLNSNPIDAATQRALYLRYELLRTDSFLYEQHCNVTFLQPAVHPVGAQLPKPSRSFLRALVQEPSLDLSAPLSSYLNSTPAFNRSKIFDPVSTSTVRLRQVSTAENDCMFLQEIDPLLGNMFTELARADPCLYLTYRFTKVTRAHLMANMCTLAGVSETEV